MMTLHENAVTAVKILFSGPAKAMERLHIMFQASGCASFK